MLDKEVHTNRKFHSIIKKKPMLYYFQKTKENLHREEKSLHKN